MPDVSYSKLSRGVGESKNRGLEEKIPVVLLKVLMSFFNTSKSTTKIPGSPIPWLSDSLRNYLKTTLCHSELVSEPPKNSNNPDEILKQVQDDTFLYVFLVPTLLRGMCISVLRC